MAQKMMVAQRIIVLTSFRVAFNFPTAGLNNNSMVEELIRQQRIAWSGTVQGMVGIFMLANYIPCCSRPRKPMAHKFRCFAICVCRA